MNVRKVRVCNLSDVSETLLIPLYCRALESRRADALLHDPWAAEILARLGYDTSRLDRNPGRAYLQTAVMLRAREFDRLGRAFLAAHPGAVVVDLGCGLDTRFWRIDDGLAEWYDLDLPEVIAVRRQVLEETPRCHFLACSALDPAWMDAVAPIERPHLFLAEALLPYLPERDVRGLVLALRERFPGSELVFDALPPIVVRLNRLNPTLRRAAGAIRWTCRQDRELESWGAGIHLVGCCRYLDCPEPRLGAGRWLRFVPGFAGSTRVLHYRLGAPAPITSREVWGQGRERAGIACEQVA